MGVKLSELLEIENLSDDEIFHVRDTSAGLGYKIYLVNLFRSLLNYTNDDVKLFEKIPFPNRIPSLQDTNMSELSEDDDEFSSICENRSFSFTYNNGTAGDASTYSIGVKLRDYTYNNDTGFITVNEIFNDEAFNDMPGFTSDNYAIANTDSKLISKNNIALFYHVLRSSTSGDIDDLAYMVILHYDEVYRVLSCVGSYNLNEEEGGTPKQQRSWSFMPFPVILDGGNIIFSFNYYDQLGGTGGEYRTTVCFFTMTPEGELQLINKYPFCLSDYSWMTDGVFNYTCFVYENWFSDDILDQSYFIAWNVLSETYIRIPFDKETGSLSLEEIYTADVTELVATRTSKKLFTYGNYFLGIENQFSLGPSGIRKMVNFTNISNFLSSGDGEDMQYAVEDVNMEVDDIDNSRTIYAITPLVIGNVIFRILTDTDGLYYLRQLVFTKSISSQLTWEELS